MSLRIFTIGIVLLTIYDNQVNCSDSYVTIPDRGNILGGITKTAWSGRKVLQFLGVKYGESTRGEKRFKPPSQAKPWSGTRDVTKPLNGCPADWLLDPHMSQQEDPEDCLHMSIYTTDLTKNYPVIVFLYADYFGRGQAKDFAPDYLLEKNIVLVVPQFRLGPLGFLSTHTSNIPGNVGVQDVILALKWIKKFISLFGGDRNSVTLAGHTGGAVITQLLTMNRIFDEMLFHKVILVSGSFFSPWAVDREPENNPLNVEHPQLCIKDPDPDRCFMSTGVTELISNFFDKKSRREKLELYNYEYRLVIDGAKGVVPSEAMDLFLNNFKNPDLYSYPTLAGVTKHGGTDILHDAYERFVYVINKIWGSSESFTKNYMVFLMMRLLGTSERTGLLNTLLERDFFSPDELQSGALESSLNHLIDLFSSVHVKSPVLQAARYAALRNPRRTYLYTFDYEGEYTDFLDGRIDNDSPFKGGVAIKDDLQYLFPRPDGKPLNSDDRKIAQAMVQLWTSFAINSMPTLPKNFVPPPMVNLTGPYFHIDSEFTVGEDFIEEFFSSVQDSNEGESIRCWECQSDINNECGNPFDGKSVAMVDCAVRRPPNYLKAGRANKCSKMVRQIGSREIIYRSCFFEDPHVFTGDCMKDPINDPHVEFRSCSVCDGDYCNSATKTYAATGAVLTFVLGRLFA